LIASVTASVAFQKAVIGHANGNRRVWVASRQSICLKLPLDTKMLILGTESIE
jgi:hypothetical protein